MSCNFNLSFKWYAQRAVMCNQKNFYNHFVKLLLSKDPEEVLRLKMK